MTSDGTIWEWNRAAEELFGFSDSEMLGATIDKVIVTPLGSGVLSADLALESRFEPCQVDAVALRRDGAKIPIWLSVSPVPDSPSQRRSFSMVARDLSDRIKVEADLRQSLADKDALLREVHHRVKNNLQVICSMLRLQSSYLPHGAARDMFKSSEERVYAMGLVHEKLYRAKSSSAVDIAGYTGELAQQVMRPYLAQQSGASNLSITTTPASLPLDRAVPFGLLLNELLANALRYGISSDGKRLITLSLSTRDGCGKLVLCDRGPGLPEGTDLSQPRTLGLRLVHALCQQLQGQLSYRYDEGAQFSVEFPLLEERRSDRGVYETDKHSDL
jgi:PAS domain S-box-containing protein